MCRSQERIEELEREVGTRQIVKQTICQTRLKENGTANELVH